MKIRRIVKINVLKCFKSLPEVVDDEAVEDP